MHMAKNRKVHCICCKEDVNRSDAEFCLMDGMYCYFCKDCLRKMQKENTQQKTNQITKKETDLTENSKFEWKEKTCEDIIEDVRNMKKMLI